MTTLERGTLEIVSNNDSDQDDPAKAHLAITYAIEDGDPFTALCGARMLGVHVDVLTSGMAVCQECKDRYESITGVKVLNA